MLFLYVNADIMQTQMPRIAMILHISHPPLIFISRSCKIKIVTVAKAHSSSWVTADLVLLQTLKSLMSFIRVCCYWVSVSCAHYLTSGIFMATTETTLKRESHPSSCAPTFDQINAAFLVPVHENQEWDICLKTAVIILWLFCCMFIF